MASHSHDVITSSENPNWRTPRWLVNALDREFGFVLDAAANARNVVMENGRFLGPGSDLLEDALCGVPWWDVVKEILHGDQPFLTHRSAIFINPAYSRKEKMPIEPWVAAMAKAGVDGTVVGVLPYSPQTAWWRNYVQGQKGDEDGQPYSFLKATEIRRFPFRIAFDPPLDGYQGKASGANVNTAIVIWRQHNGFIEPWIPYERYWVPSEFHAHKSRDRRAQAVSGNRAAGESGE